MTFRIYEPIGPRRRFNSDIRRSLYALEQDRIRLRFATLEPIRGMPPAVGRYRLRKLPRKSRPRRRISAKARPF